ncbi:hypothetical protein RT99_20290 [Flavobacterium sp. MEB061]|uniref:hypothetical protein n=1 Tax=Flavobacterium sp. MEB061 TaxID=1587524 RepID=UPI0005AC5321|nr:hypothetical protein [Flavobacterium sp. MEB061]KIQ16415.1 hypothetical protein RT99_20290 [Flavobacterium sp. MEB061]
MDTSTIAKIIFGFIGTISVSSTVLWFFTNKASEFLAKQYQEKVSHNFEKKLEAYKIELDVLKATTLKYNDKQFELYLDLWKRLQELKFACNDLWEEASKSNLNKFAIALSSTHQQIEISSILIEDIHYDELVKIITTFQEYDSGKGRLIKAYKSIDLNRRNIIPNNHLERDVNEYQINEMIEYNRVRKDRCIAIIEEMKSSIKELIKGKKE